MIIKFSCKNHCLDFEKTEDELQNEKVIRHCPWCGEKLKIENIGEILDEDIKKQVEQYVTNCLKSLGWEGTIEAVEHLQNKRTKEYYQTELRKRGLIK
jgi:predicted RNA-binding protein Jag